MRTNGTAAAYRLRALSRCASTLPPVTTIPEKPSLEGLEAKWRARWEADGTYRFDRTKTRAEVFSIDTPPPTVSGSLHIGHVMSLLAHRPHRPLPAHARQGGLLPDGVGRQRPQRGAPRPARHRDHRRPHPSLRPRASAVPRRSTRRPAPSRSAGRTSSSCARRSSRSSRPSTTSSGRPSGCRSTGTTRTRRSAPRPPARRSEGSCASCERDLAYRSESPTLWDVDMRTSVAQAELDDREIAGRVPHSSCSAAPTARC